MKKPKTYLMLMEFIGHHTIEFEAESDEEATRMVADGDWSDTFPPKCDGEAHEVEDWVECEPVSLTVRNYDGPNGGWGERPLWYQ